MAGQIVTKQCTKCKKNLPLESFNKKKGCRFGVASTCKQCNQEYQRNYRNSPHGRQVRRKNRRSPAAISYKKKIRAKEHEQAVIRKEEYLLEVKTRTHKSCARCKKVLHISKFHQDKYSLDGLCYACIDCMKTYRNKPSVKIRTKAYLKQYRQKEDVKIRNRIACLKWKRKHPDWWKAHEAVRQAIRRGEIAQPTKHKCCHCSKKAKHYHHFAGYSREHWLDVVPLCIICHRRIHSTTNHSKESVQGKLMLSDAPVLALGIS